MAIRKSPRRWYHDRPLRQKLVLSFLAVIAAGGIVSLIFGTRLEHRTIISLAETKIRHDLDSAWMVYHERLNDIRDVVRLSAMREFVVDHLKTAERTDLLRKLNEIRQGFQLDILTLTDASGRVLVRSRNPGISGDDQSADPIIRRAIAGQTAAGTQIVSKAELLKEGRDLADRAFFEFIPTPMAAERPGEREENGMALKAASPVIDADGRILGVLTGGVLLNRNYEIVDRVKDIVFRGEKYKNKDIGTATIFQRDLRIATNVLDDAGERAIGTRVSRDVNEAVLVEGRRYLGRAFVVSHWYITAYDPIRDPDDKIIGMLYVGMLEKPYIDLRNRVMGTFTLMAGLAVVVLLALNAVIASNITRPIGVLVKATAKVARGDFSHQVEIETGDEIGQLSVSFNEMTEELRQASESLTQWGRTLEKRVEERTAELRTAQENLIRSEKLASLGKIAAGVAHEINNPLTSILINTALLIEARKPDDPDAEALNMIADETNRCAQIVKQLLEFSRQRPAQESPTDINELIERTAQILEKQALVRNIRIVKRLERPFPEIELDKAKLQQVFSNLMINAVEAMPPEGGTLTVTSRLDAAAGQIEVEFADTGVGIRKENLDKLFDPFFTTKTMGTGLGLAVSYGIVRQRGGTITVESEIGRGSVFTVKLPLVETQNGKSSEEVQYD
jgi:two-component system NtrC family sensor kinase